MYASTLCMCCGIRGERVAFNSGGRGRSNNEQASNGAIKRGTPIIFERTRLYEHDLRTNSTIHSNIFDDSLDACCQERLHNWAEAGEAVTGMWFASMRHPDPMRPACERSRLVRARFAAAVWRGETNRRKPSETYKYRLVQSQTTQKPLE
jgi:hypothetical protein